MSFTELELGALMVCPQFWLAVKWIPDPEAEALAILLWTYLKGKGSWCHQVLAFLHNETWPGVSLCLHGDHGPHQYPWTSAYCPRVRCGRRALGALVCTKPLIHHSRQSCLFCPVDISKGATTIAASIPLAWDFAEPDLQRGQGEGKAYLGTCKKTLFLFAALISRLLLFLSFWKGSLSLASQSDHGFPV